METFMANLLAFDGWLAERTAFHDNLQRWALKCIVEMWRPGGCLNVLNEDTNYSPSSVVNHELA
jgi:hypothetical protein